MKLSPMPRQHLFPWTPTTAGYSLCVMRDLYRGQNIASDFRPLHRSLPQSRTARLCAVNRVLQPLSGLGAL